VIRLDDGNKEGAHGQIPVRLAQRQGHLLLAGFPCARVSPHIRAVVGVELEHAEPAPLDPQTLLGEPGSGKRGANQTSSDVAFIVTTERGRGLILTENKLSEHHF
jgi:hypothetical protein